MTQRWPWFTLVDLLWSLFPHTRAFETDLAMRQKNRLPGLARLFNEEAWYVKKFSLSFFLNCFILSHFFIYADSHHCIHPFSVYQPSKIPSLLNWRRFINIKMLSRRQFRQKKRSFWVHLTPCEGFFHGLTTQFPHTVPAKTHVL